VAAAEDQVVVEVARVEEVGDRVEGAAAKVEAEDNVKVEAEDNAKVEANDRVEANDKVVTAGKGKVVANDKAAGKERAVHKVEMVNADQVAAKYAVLREAIVVQPVTVREVVHGKMAMTVAVIAATKALVVTEALKVRFASHPKYRPRLTS
jgi:hypothetical protein